MNLKTATDWLAAKLTTNAQAQANLSAGLVQLATGAVLVAIDKLAAGHPAIAADLKAGLVLVQPAA